MSYSAHNYTTGILKGGEVCFTGHLLQPVADGSRVWCHYFLFTFQRCVSSDSFFLPPFLTFLLLLSFLTHFKSLCLHLFSSPPSSLLLYCLLPPLLHENGGSPDVFFGAVGSERGGGGLAVRRGEKRASKTKRGCLRARQAGNASLPGLSPSRCSLAILQAPSILNLTAPLSRGNPPVICPFSSSFCPSSYCFVHLSFVWSYSNIFPFFLSCNLTPFMTLIVCFHFGMCVLPLNLPEPLCWCAQRMGALLKSLGGVKSWEAGD